MKEAAKTTTLKAKTLIDAMQTLNLIPSFSTSNFGGDVLPENILIKNILGKFPSQYLDSGKIVYTGTIVFTEIDHWTIVFTALDNCLHKHL